MNYWFLIALVFRSFQEGRRISLVHAPGFKKLSVDILP